MGGGSKCTPAVSGGTVYAGADDGVLYAFDAKTGRLKWTYATGGEILTEPLVANDSVYFGSGDGKLYAVDTAGKLRWTFSAGGSIYSSPVLANGLVLFGSNDGSFYAVDAASGKLAWQNTEPDYTVECKPAVSGDTVYFGAWDTYLYAVNVRDGTLRWKCIGQGSADQKAAKKYYSPADCGPVASGGVVLVADRDYKLSLVDAETGKRKSFIEKCSAVGLSEDGQFAYLRRTDGAASKGGGSLTKIDLSGRVIWSVPAHLGYIPAAPREYDGVVYVASGTGLVSAISAADGGLLWEYQATPQLYVFSSVTASDGVAYVTGMDGSLTAISAQSSGG